MEFTLSTDNLAKAGLPDRLVGAALTLLGQAGTEAVSLRAVARAAGVSAMAPYRHFPDKEALLAAVAARGFVGLRTALQAADDGARADGALVAQAAAYVGFARANPALFRLMFGPPRAGCHPQLDAAGDTAFGVLARRVGAQAGDVAHGDLALGCWAFVHGLAMLFLDGRLAHVVDAPDEVTRRVAAAMMAYAR